jgi:ApeA N-terminal domain 1
MDSSEIECLSWLPENPSHRVSGTLVAEPSRFRLITHVALRRYEPPPPVDGVVIYSFGDSRFVSYRVVYGYSREREQVTLMNVIGFDMSGPFEATTESYDVDIALMGGHIEADRFSSVSVEYDWLDAWLDPPSISGSSVGVLDASVIEQMPLTLWNIAQDRTNVKFKVGVVGKYGQNNIHLDRVGTHRLLISLSVRRRLR